MILILKSYAKLRKESTGYYQKQVNGITYKMKFVQMFLRG